MVKRCLLFIEDYPVVQDMYVEVLRKEGFEVHIAPTGEEALQEAEIKHFDAVIVDLLLPKMNGVEFLKQYKQLPGSKDAKIIVLTDFDDPRFVKEVHKLGVQHYWMKVNNTPHELAHKIKEVLSS